LAERGYRVTGADPSAAMLRQAQQMAQQMQLDITFIRATFKELPRLLTDQFDAVLALGNGLCHQERREDIVESLLAMRQLCLPSGICLIGIKDFDAIRRDRPRFQGHQIRDQGGERTICFEVWDYADPLLISTAYTITGHSKEWGVHSAETREYMLGADEFIICAEEAGFGTVQRLEHSCEAVYALS
jgi:ubiquinone/menaquinone biosynthesis C-methylase UbiE